MRNTVVATATMSPQIFVQLYLRRQTTKTFILHGIGFPKRLSFVLNKQVQGVYAIDATKTKQIRKVQFVVVDISYDAFSGVIFLVRQQIST